MWYTPYYYFLCKQISILFSLFLFSCMALDFVHKNSTNLILLYSHIAIFPATVQQSGYIIFCWPNWIANKKKQQQQQRLCILMKQQRWCINEQKKKELFAFILSKKKIYEIMVAPHLKMWCNDFKRFNILANYKWKLLMRCSSTVYKIQNTNNIDNADDCHRATNYNFIQLVLSLCSHMHYARARVSRAHYAENWTYEIQKISQMLKYAVGTIKIIYYYRCCHPRRSHVVVFIVAYFK